MASHKASHKSLVHPEEHISRKGHTLVKKAPDPNSKVPSRYHSWKRPKSAESYIVDHLKGVTHVWTEPSDEPQVLVVATHMRKWIKYDEEFALKVLDKCVRRKADYKAKHLQNSNDDIDLVNPKQEKDQHEAKTRFETVSDSTAKGANWCCCGKSNPQKSVDETEKPTDSGVEILRDFIDDSDLLECIPKLETNQSRFKMASDQLKNCFKCGCRCGSTEPKTGHIQPKTQCGYKVGKFQPVVDPFTGGVRWGCCGVAKPKSDSQQNVESATEQTTDKNASEGTNNNVSINKETVCYSKQAADLIRNHPLFLMVKYDRRKLLQHPLVRYLVHKKWLAARAHFHASLLFHILLLIFFETYVVGNLLFRYLDSEVAISERDSAFKHLPWFVMGMWFCTCGMSSLGLALIVWRLYRSKMVLKAFFLVHWIKKARHFIHPSQQHVNVQIEKVKFDPTEDYISLMRWEMVCHAMTVTYVYATIYFTEKKFVMIGGSVAVITTWLILLLQVRMIPVFGPQIVLFIEISKKYLTYVPIGIWILLCFSTSFLVLLNKLDMFNSIHSALVSTGAIMLNQLTVDEIIKKDNLYGNGTGYQKMDTSNGSTLVATFFLLLIFVLVACLAYMNMLINVISEDTKQLEEFAEYHVLARQTVMVVTYEFMQATSLNPNNKLLKLGLYVLRLLPRMIEFVIRLLYLFTARSETRKYVGILDDLKKVADENGKNPKAKLDKSSKSESVVSSHTISSNNSSTTTSAASQHHLLLAITYRLDRLDTFALENANRLDSFALEIAALRKEVRRDNIYTPVTDPIASKKKATRRKRFNSR